MDLVKLSGFGFGNTTKDMQAIDSECQPVSSRAASDVVHEPSSNNKLKCFLNILSFGPCGSHMVIRLFDTAITSSLFFTIHVQLCQHQRGGNVRG